MKELEKCLLCPVKCGANRHKTYGACKAGENVKIARADLHEWEEPVLCQRAGSGAVFFSGCSLGCVFCQNGEISHGGFGAEVSVERLAEIFLDLEAKNACNINLVTGAQYAPHIVKAVASARKNGLKLPIVYNSSGYENVETLKLLEGTVDIYLPDFKYMDEELAVKYSKRRNYPSAAKAALKEMFRQAGAPAFDSDGLMKKGMIVRHLVLPSMTEDSKNVIKYLYDTYKDDIYISIMSQYTPHGDLSAYPEIDRKLTEREYDDVVSFAMEIGVENGFLQEGEAADESFIPAFDLKGVLK